MKIEKTGSEVVVYPEGRIDISNAGDFKDEITSLIDEGSTVINLDFSQVSGIDSSGLGKLLLFQKQLKEKGGELKITNVNSEHIQKIFSLVHLYKVINIEGLS